MDCDKLIGIGNLGTDKALECDGGAFMVPGRDSGMWACAFGIGDGVCGRSTSPVVDEDAITGRRRRLGLGEEDASL